MQTRRANEVLSGQQECAIRIGLFFIKETRYLLELEIRTEPTSRMENVPPLAAKGHRAPASWERELDLSDLLGESLDYDESSKIIMWT